MLMRRAWKSNWCEAGLAVFVGAMSCSAMDDARLATTAARPGAAECVFAAPPPPATDLPVESAAPALPDVVRVVLGLDPGKMNFGVRLVAANRLPKTLPQETQLLLFAFLSRTEAVGMSENELDALKNDILNALIDQAAPVPDFSQRLADMYHAELFAAKSSTVAAESAPTGSAGDSPTNPSQAQGRELRTTAQPSSAVVPTSVSRSTLFPSSHAAGSGNGTPDLLPRQNPAWRDYCIQFLGIRYGKTGDSAERKAIWRVLNEALCDREGAIAATALLALYRNIGADPGLETETVSGALSLLRQDDSSAAVRMTALQVGAELCSATSRPGVSLSGLHGAERIELLNLARKLAKDGKTSAVLRISAIAAVGMLGNISDKPMLDEMARDNGSRLQVAAATAARKIAQR